MSDNDRKDEATAQTLRSAIRAGSDMLEPTDRIAKALQSRVRREALSDVHRQQAVRAVRVAAIDRRLEAVRASWPSSAGISGILRSARTAAGVNEQDLAERLNIGVGQLRDAESSATAVLAWPAESLADVLEVLDIPLHVIRSSLRRRPRNPGDALLYQAAASLPDDGPPFSHPTLADTARILRERGLARLLVPR